MNNTRAITISAQHTRLRILLLTLSAATMLLLTITPTPTYAASSSACSVGQVAYHDSTQGLICKSLSSILGSTTDTKVCPSGEYLMGFDTGAGVDVEDGTFKCRPDAQGVSGGVSVSCSSGYLTGFTLGSPHCGSFAPSASDRLSSVGTCSSARKEYLKGFNSSGKVCLSMPRGAY